MSGHSLCQARLFFLMLLLQAWNRWEAEGLIPPDALAEMNRARNMGVGRRAAEGEIIACFIPKEVTFSTKQAFQQSPLWQGYCNTRTEMKYKGKQEEGLTRTAMLALLGPELLESGLASGDVTVRTEDGRNFFFMQKRLQAPMHRLVFA